MGTGFGLVIRHQRILWWVFAVNFILGGLGASSAARTLGHALHHSLAGEKLAHGFDLGMFLELVSQPDVKLFSHSGGIFLFAALYFLFLLFVTPGIIASYLEDRRFTTGEFFGTAGTFVWAFVRLALWSLIPFLLVDLLYQAVKAISEYVGDRVAADQIGFCILVIGSIPVLLLWVWVRLWFDLAQVRAVAGNDRVTRRNVVRTFQIAMRRSWHAYWAYVLIGILVGLVTIVALLIWTKVPARAVPITFLLLELIMLTHIFGRLWQKACATTWYRMNPEPVPSAPEPFPFQPLVAPPLDETTDPALDVDAPLSAEVGPGPDKSPSSEGSSRAE